MPRLAAVGQSHDQIILLCRQEPNLTPFFNDNIRYMPLLSMTLTELFCTVIENGFWFWTLCDSKQVILL